MTPFPLVADGKPEATIVLAKKPTRAAQLAACELRFHIQEITGAQLPLATDADAVPGPRVLVGDSRATQALGLCNADFERQEYVIQVRPDTLIVMGRDKEDRGEVRYDIARHPEMVERQLAVV